MKKILLISLIYLNSCSSNIISHKDDIIFTEDLTFDEFKNKLYEYAKINTYPNIDN